MADLIPPRRGEFFTPDGIPTHRFITWIESLTTTANASVTNITNLGVRESYPWRLNGEPKQDNVTALFPVNESRQKKTHYHFEAQRQKTRCFTTTANATLVSGDFVNAKQSATITLPEYPEESAMVTIRNGDGTRIGIDGNGRNINGSSTGIISSLGTAINLYYFLDSDEWFAR